MVYVPFTIFVRNQGLPLPDITTASTSPSPFSCWLRLAPMDEHTAAPPARAQAPFIAVDLPPLNDPDFEVALHTAVRNRPQAVIVRSVLCGADIQNLAVALSVAELDAGLPEGQIAILAQTADTAAGAAFPPDLRHLTPRLRGLIWDEACLRQNLGLSPASDSNGQDLTMLARTQLLLSARAAGLMALSTLPEDVAFGADAVTLLPQSQKAMQLGFDGVIVGSRSAKAIRAIPGPSATV
ncbi:HpcH/HpaI aldolase/citrate lyase family protein [Rhizobium sp. RU35A]|uniref:aldolase/citrate lyase family protein n=1 Tax=Rhizobium sp. RU35A TaxID=1907414 RepID=UPI00095540CE|nr:aldolase/citrate lyase family protein [Rhizobium sp. RU35A]SIQ76254.1 HpcH/HpaI aldolase/citrate lyase family protein [Rhizobium sp. RU35A]